MYELIMMVFQLVCNILGFIFDFFFCFFSFVMNFINFFGLSYENDEFSGFKDEVDEGGR